MLGSTDMRHYNYKIYNSAGVLVIQDVIYAESYLISLEDLDKGLYFVLIRSLKGYFNIVQKLIID
jgi:hypothetical protein